MRWFDADFSRRFPVVLDGSATTAGTVDATIALTGTAAEFWATVQADLDDVRVSAANGIKNRGCICDMSSGDSRCVDTHSSCSAAAALFVASRGKG